MAKKGLIALFSGIGIVGIMLVLAIIATIVGVLIWYFDYYKKKHGTEKYKNCWYPGCSGADCYLC